MEMRPKALRYTTAVFYEYFSLMLALAVAGATALTAWLTVSQPRQTKVQFANHNRTLAVLERDPGLARQNEASFRILDHPEATLWVSPSGLCLIWLPAPSKSTEMEPQGALYQPMAVKGWLTCWVDPAHWRAPLKIMVRLQLALKGQGPWASLAYQHGLTLQQSPQGLPMLEGYMEDRLLQIEATGTRLRVNAAVDPSLRMVPGSGQSGNPVLDACMDSAGVPDHLIAPMLELLHSQGGLCEGGRLRTEWSGSVDDLIQTLGPVLGYQVDPSTPRQA